MLVSLSKVYDSPVGGFSAVELREPTYKDVFMDGLGRPQEWQPSGGGKAIVVTYASVVDAYLQRLVVAPGYEYIGRLSAIDALKLEKAVCDFFMEARISTDASISSSSGSDGMQAASA